MNDGKHELNTKLEPKEFLRDFKKSVQIVTSELKRSQMLITLITRVICLNTPPENFREINDVFQENAGEIEKMKLSNHQLLVSWTKLGAAFDEVKLKGEGLKDG